jgi:hypothetical protein
MKRCLLLNIGPEFLDERESHTSSKEDFWADISVLHSRVLDMAIYFLENNPYFTLIMGTLNNPYLMIRP